jgi:hypothetical protein
MTLPERAVLIILYVIVLGLGLVSMSEDLVEQMADDYRRGEGGIRRALQSIIEAARIQVFTGIECGFGRRQVSGDLEHGPESARKTKGSTSQRSAYPVCIDHMGPASRDAEVTIDAESAPEGAAPLF